MMGCNASQKASLDIAGISWVTFVSSSVNTIALMRLA